MTKFSIITVCFNSEKTISQTIESIKNQKFQKYEHIIIDGKSTDNTLNIIQTHQHQRMQLYSEPDDGLYDAMNKGIKKSVGEYIVFLNSDDFFSNSEVLTKVDQKSKTNADIIYGGVNFFSNLRDNARTWLPEDWLEITGKKIHLPHPAMFVKRATIDHTNRYFDTSLQIAADLKQQLQLMHYDHCTGTRINEVLVDMRLGGKSTGCVNKVLESWTEAYAVYHEIFGLKGYFYCSRKIYRKLKQMNVNPTSLSKILRRKKR